MARSTYYYHLKTKSVLFKYTEEKSMIKDIYHNHKGRYSYRRITEEMSNKGHVINHKTVLRLMKMMGLKSRIRVKRYKSYKGEVGRIAPDLLKRNFKSKQPCLKWATDITEFKVKNKKLYLSPIMELYNGKL